VTDIRVENFRCCKAVRFLEKEHKFKQYFFTMENTIKLYVFV